MGRKGSGGKGKSKGKAASKAASEEAGKGSVGKSKGKAPVGPPRVADAVQAPDPKVARFDRATGSDKFQGGRAVVCEPQQCSQCNGYFSVASCFVMSHKDGTIPVMNSHTITEAKKKIKEIESGETADFTNLLSAEDYPVLWCYYCYGEKIKGNRLGYLTDTQEGFSKVSSEFGNPRKRFYGRGSGTEEKLVEWLFEKAMSKENEVTQVRLADAHLIICKQPNVAFAADFVIDLGGGLYLLYTRGECDTGPFNPKYWLRCTKQAARDLAGGTTQHGYWHCPASGCLDRWSWKKGGCRRVLVLPDVDNSGDDSGETKKQVVIGNVTTEQEHTITLLKSARLITTAVGTKNLLEKEIGIPALVDAIEKLNTECEGRLIASNLPRKTITAASANEIKNKQIIPYCEHSALSLSHPGLPYTAMVVNESTPVITDDDRQRLLDVLTCFYDLTEVKPKNAGALMNAWKKAEAKQSEMRRLYWPAAEREREPRAGAAASSDR